MDFVQGDKIKIDGTFQTEAGVAIDPTTVKITIVRPDGMRNTYVYGTDAAVVRTATGSYYIEVSAVIPGAWVYWWHSTGTGQAADERTFLVEAALAADPPGTPGTLELTYLQILREVGRLLGLSREPNKWETSARQDVADIIRSGLRRFYWSPVLPTADGKGATVHTWSFLKGTATITLGSGDSMYALPDDFGEMLDGVFTHAAGSGATKPPIGIIKEDQLRQLQAAANVSGTPKYAAIRQVAGTPMRYEALFYPTPDATTTLTFDYSIAPPDLSETHPHPYGGPQHAETILEAILAAAEKTLLDTEGVHEKRFLECLARSIAADRNLSTGTDDGPWPVDSDLPADGLNVSKGLLRRMIGRKLGYAPHQATWSHRQAEEVNLVLQAGLRKFYSPMALPGEKFGHEWSFLRPVYYLTTASDVDRYDLPEEFSLIDGPLLHAPTAAALYPPINVVGENLVRQRQQLQTATGRPSLAAVRPKPLDPSGTTRWELILYPMPDGEYPLSYRCQINPAAMPEDACLPYGGQQHAQTVLEACLCAAEEHLASTGTLTTKQLVHGQKFVECLIRSVGHDRKANSPASLGRNVDGSDQPVDWNYHDAQEVIHTYNGQLY